MSGDETARSEAIRRRPTETDVSRIKWLIDPPLMSSARDWHVARIGFVGGFVGGLLIGRTLG